MSPDERQFAFVEVSENSLAVKVIPATGGEARELVYVSKPSWLGYQPLAWSLDGLYVFFAKCEFSNAEVNHSDLWRVPVEGGSPENLNLEMEGLGYLRVHPDGRRIAFTAGTQRYDLWVMENFLPKPQVVSR